MIDAIATTGSASHEKWNAGLDEVGGVSLDGASADPELGGQFGARDDSGGMPAENLDQLVLAFDPCKHGGLVETDPPTDHRHAASSAIDDKAWSPICGQARRMNGWKADMIELADHAFGRLRTRLVGLTDHEYAWQSVPDCWKPGDWEDGVWPAPFTTLGWRLTHVINNLNDPRYASQLGLAPRGEPAAAPPSTAAEALDRLDRGWHVTRSYLEDLDEQTLTTKIGVGPWADSDRGAFVLHMIDELIHHAAEIALLRDLYRASQPPNPAIEILLSRELAEIDKLDPALIDRARSEHPDLLLRAAAIANPTAIEILAELDFPTELPNGTSALHFAAGAGDAPTVHCLVDLGADTQTRDGHYRATPAEWADYFGHATLADELRA